MPNKMVADAGEAPVGIVDSSTAFSCGRAVAPISRWRLIAALQVAEALAVAMSSCSWFRDVVPEEGSRSGPFAMLSFAFAVALVVHFVLRSLGAYDFTGILNVWRSSTTAAVAWILATAPLLSTLIKQGPFNALWQSLFLHWLDGGVCIVLVRFAAGYAGAALLTARRLNHAVAIVGAGSEAQLCAQLLRADKSGGHPVGFISPEKDCSGLLETERYASFIAKVQQLIQTHQVKDVIVAIAESDKAQLPDLVHRPRCLPVRVLLWPRSIGIEAEWIASSECKVGTTPLLMVSAPPLDGWHWVLKDAQDRILALLLLLLCLPVLLGIAVAIRLCSPGPILFRQEREGYNGKRFVIFKFRTMRVAPDEADQLILTVKNDPRVFPLGALLRKASLDELPQLLNVIRGDMWLVGPRPHSPLATAAGQRYPVAAKRYMARFRMKPGITGLAQVKGWRGATNTIEQIQQRVLHDLYYIEHWSMWLDFRILLQTVVKGFIHRNAY
jgi:Undecaprenyl-phosphate glucose phosphotransferase